jgi:hypothetical protein
MFASKTSIRLGYKGLPRTNVLVYEEYSRIIFAALGLAKGNTFNRQLKITNSYAAIIKFYCFF